MSRAGGKIAPHLRQSGSLEQDAATGNAQRSSVFRCGLIDMYGDDIVSARITAGFAEPALKPKQSTTVRSEPISNEELDAKAVANDVACPSAQRALEIASEPTQLLHCGSPRNARAAEGVKK